MIMMVECRCNLPVIGDDEEEDDDVDTYNTEDDDEGEESVSWLLTTTTGTSTESIWMGPYKCVWLGARWSPNGEADDDDAEGEDDKEEDDSASVDDSVGDSDRWDIATDVGESFFPFPSMVVLLLLVVVMVVVCWLEWVCSVRWDNTLTGSTRCMTWKEWYEYDMIAWCR